MSTPHKRTLTILAIILVAFGVTLLQVSPAEIVAFSQQLYEKAMKFNMVLDKIERFYVDERRPEELVEDAIQGMLSNLDPHSIYLSAESYQQFKKEFEGYYGIGIKYDLVGDHFVILSVEEHSPSFAQGLQQGDKIMAIEGVPTEGLRYGELIHKLNGPPNTNVQLLIQRNGWPEPREFVIPRLQIAVDSIPSAFMIEPGVGFIKIVRFTSTTADELDIAFAQLRSEGMKNLILDLRDNTGGSLLGAETVADRFISGGKIIVYTKGRTASSSERYVATNASSLPICPLLILVNQITASGAEIVAGAIQDWDRGLIVGETTFGKALVQSEFPFQDGSALLLTTARYYTPLGRMIQREYGRKSENKYIQPEDKSKRPAYTTPTGRIVYGGGSITPDVFIPGKPREISAAVKRLCLAKNRFFFAFADAYVEKHLEISKDLDQFVREFNVSKALFEEFTHTVTSSGFKFSAAEFHSNASEIKFLIKQELARRIWGEQGAYRVAHSVDSQLTEALKHIDKAAALLRH